MAMSAAPGGGFSVECEPTADRFVWDVGPRPCAGRRDETLVASADVAAHAGASGVDGARDDHAVEAFAGGGGRVAAASRSLKKRRHCWNCATDQGVATVNTELGPGLGHISGRLTSHFFPSPATTGQALPMASAEL